MVDGVKSCSEVQEDEDAEVAGFCREEEVDSDFKEGCFCAMLGMEVRLKRFKEVSGEEVDFEWQRCVSVFLIKKKRGGWRLARNLS